MTPANPLTLKLGHIVIYRNSGYTQICEVSKSIFDDILNGNPNYFYLPITKGFLKAQNAELISEDMYKIGLAITYNFRTKSVFNGGELLCKMEYCHTFQNLIELISGNPQQIKINEKILI